MVRASATWLRAGLLLLGVVVLAAFVSADDVRQGLASLGRVSPSRILLVAVLLVANLAVKALRWQVMVGRFAGVRLRWSSALAAVVAGVAAGSLAPARSVELGKPLLLRRSHGTDLAASTAAVLIERLMDGASLAVLCGMALLVLPVGQWSLLRIVILALGILLVGGAALFLMPERLARWSRALLRRVPLRAPTRAAAADLIDRLAGGLLIWRHGGRLAGLLSLSVLAAVVEALRVVAVFAAVGVAMSLPQAMFTFGAANLVAIATLIPGGIGVTEASMAGIAALLLPAGTSRAAIAGASVADRLVSYYLLMALGGAVLVLAATRKQNSGTGTM